MTTIYLSLSAQVAKSTFFMKSPVCILTDHSALTGSLGQKVKQTSCLNKSDKSEIILQTGTRKKIIEYDFYLRREYLVAVFHKMKSFQKLAPLLQVLWTKPQYQKHDF